MSSKKARVEKLRRENESLERDVERFNEREKLQQEAADMRKKLPWLEFEKAKATWCTAKQELAACKQLVKDKEAELVKYKVPHDKCVAALEAALAEEKAKRQATKARVGGRGVGEDELGKRVYGVRRSSRDGC